MLNNKIIGLIGGMGPYASAYFYKLLLNKSNKSFGAVNNDDFPEVLIDSVPVPDFISDTTQLVAAQKILISRVKKLNEYGCTSIGMICNTGHILYPELKKYTNGNFVSMIQSVSKYVTKIGLERIGIFATKTTIKTELYQKEFYGTNIEVVLPPQETISILDDIIRNVIAVGKTDKYEDILYDESKKFINKQSLDGIILGCTELPLIFPKNRNNNIIDCLDVFADSLLTEYYS